MGLMHCCREEVVAVSPDTPAVEIARIMDDKNVGSVMVVTSEDRPAGIVTDRDLVVRILAKGARSEDVTAEEIMTKDLVTFRDDMGIYEAIEKVAREGVRRMPIVDDSGRLIGIITQDDMIRMLSDEMGKLAHTIEKQSPPLPR
ncbi:signal transduction protein [Methanoculleus taiwanensis]|uniref:Signal transduction protein n=1 Tax=Methanoculleus taiwanensis TaxID=1550565 RepID=A0A498H2I5_9EURY|nr:CBS domain-containing protein [Methanoculleus taiwanensis]RXE56993.1 signal transduction protein [Methanoculleus taiwanensis]